MVNRKNINPAVNKSVNEIVLKEQSYPLKPIPISDDANAVMTAMLTEKHFANQRHSDLPFISGDDAIKTLQKVFNQLLKLGPKGMQVFLDIRQLILLSLSVQMSKPPQLSDELSNSDVAVVRAYAKEMVVAQMELRTIFEKIQEDDFYYENFESALDETTYPHISRKLLPMQRATPLIVQTQFGPIDLTLPADVPKDLPSKQMHRLLISLNGGYSDGEKRASVRLHGTYGAYGNGARLLQKGELYELTVGQSILRKPLLEAQLHNRVLEINVSIPRVKLFTKSKVLPLLVLQEIFSTHDEASPSLMQLRLEFN